MGPGRALHYELYRAMWGALDFVFPPACVDCGMLGSHWCITCLSKVERPPSPLCEVCGSPISTGTVCPSCRRERPAFHILRAWAPYVGGARAALQRLKYRNDMGLGAILAEQLAALLKDLAWPADVVVPVPLARRRLRYRGYNQADLIGWPLAVTLGLEYMPNSLCRARDTRSQVGLTMQERRENVRGAFSANGAQVRGRTVLLVDDVATTTSTLSSAAAALLTAGAYRVYAVTAARALPEHGLQQA